MGAAVYAITGSLTLGLWLITHGLWIKALRQANGSRPFIGLTVAVAWIMTALSVTMVVSTVVSQPDSDTEYILGYIYMLCSLAVCISMWHLHYAIQQIAKRLPRE